MPNQHTTVKERLFARYVAEGYTQSESVRRAGYQGNPNKLGSKLVQRKDVMQLIEQRAKELEDERALTLDDHLSALATLRDDAKDAGQYSAAIQAEHHRGKAARLYVEQSHVIEQSLDTPADILARLNNLLDDKSADSI